MCLTPLYLSLFLQCPRFYICIVCIYILKLYLPVFLCLLLVFSVNCMHQRSESSQFSICMCCTCGRIDNKADFDIDFDIHITGNM